MNAEIPQNPYPSSFAGRQDALMRLHQYLKDPSGGTALVLSGWPTVGKTTLLRQFDNLFDDTHIGVYIPMKSMNGEAHFLRTLVEETIKTLAEREFNLSRVPDVPEQVDRNWLSQNWLPEVTSAIRHHRQIVWLLDDAHTLTAAVQAGQMDTDIFAYLCDLLTQFARLRLVMTIDIEDESNLSRMGNLVRPTHVIRLTHLSRADTAALLREPVSDLYGLTEEAVDEVYRATGGRPLWVQRFGVLLYDGQPTKLVTAADVKALFPIVYTQSQTELGAIWSSLSDNERLILSAIGSLLYDDPLSQLDAGLIAGWLVDTDYPLDETSIHAAVRSLEYREIVAISDLAHIHMTATLLQRWAIENGRLSEKSHRFSTRQRMGLILLVLLIIALIFAVTLLPQSAPASSTPVPTVTLVRPGA